MNNKSSYEENKWRNLGITYYLNKEANIMTEIAVKRTYMEWESSIDRKISFNYKGRNQAGLNRDGKNTVSFLTEWPAEVPDTNIAYCKNWFDHDGYIIESDIIFNMSLVKFTTESTRKPDSYYIESVLGHEIGHMIGLSHSDSSESIMKAKLCSDDSFSNARIDSQTIERFHKLYK